MNCEVILVRRATKRIICMVIKTAIRPILNISPFLAYFRNVHDHNLTRNLTNLIIN